LILIAVLWAVVSAILFAVAINFLSLKSALQMGLLVPLAYLIGCIAGAAVAGIIFATGPIDPRYQAIAHFCGFVTALLSARTIWRSGRKFSQS
jgi:hypothetical protein